MKRILHFKKYFTGVVKKQTWAVFLISFWIIGAANIQAQAYQWAKNIGSTGPDQGFSIILDASGNVYTTGIFVGTADFDPGPGTFNLTSAGDRDIFITKMDAAGNFVWAKKMGGEGYDFGYSIAIDANGNIFIGGSFDRTADFDPGTGVYNLSPASSGYSDIYIVKLDASGNFIWAKSIGASSGDIAFAIAVDASGNVYATGQFMTIVDFDPGPGTYNLNSSQGSVFILKLDAGGNFVWAGNLGGSGNGNAITVDASGNVYTTGQFYNTGDFDPGTGTYNLTASGNGEVFISKLNSSGNFVWARNFAENGYINTITVDASGNVYTTGGFSETKDFDPGAGTYNLTSAGSFDIFLSKLDAGGNFVWAKRMGGSGEDRGYSMTMDSDKNLYITGYFTGTVDFDPGAGTHNLTSAGSNDIFISRFDANGDFLWARNLGGSDIDRGLSIAVNATGKIYLTGFFSGTADFNPPLSANLTSKGSWDIFICKYSNIGLGLIEEKVGKNFTIYPNPTNGNLKINLGEQQALVEIKITNVLGQEITKKQYVNASMLDLEIRGETGVYFLSVRSGIETVIFRILKQ